MKKILTQSELKELIIYNPDTGIFTNKITRNNKSAKKGDVAGTFDKDGYIIIAINRKALRAHRLAWLYMEGYFPEYEVEHMDRDESNNKWNNLRHTTRQCNARNCGLSVRNTSSITGVSFNSKRGKWRAYINIDGVFKHRGLFKEFSNAVRARWDAEVEYNFPNCCTTSSAYEYLKKHNLLDKE